MDKPDLTELMQLQLITLMRIYDAQLMILHHLNEEAFNHIETKHKNFDYIGYMPFIEKEEE